MDDSRISLQAAIAAVTPISSHAYHALLPLDHCHGTVAHGGFLASLILHTVQKHFNSTLEKYSQPHAFSLHIIFLRPATAGSASLKVQDVKPGPGVSVTNVILDQKGKERVVAYASNVNMHSERGITYDIGYRMDPKPLSADLNKLAGGMDGGWVGWAFPWHPESLLKAATHIRAFFPINGPPRPNITDVWLTPCSASDTFTTETLGSVADTWHRMPENNLPNTVWSNASLVSTANQSAQGLIKDTEIGRRPPSHFYPTLSMSLEIKRSLPPEGVKWLFVRAQAKEVRNGRMDVEVMIFDQDMELVALSHQICLVIENTEVLQEKKARGGKL